MSQSALKAHYDIAIIGSGFSGLCMAIACQQAGREDFIILEKNAALGGTWRDNHYPGAACDVPSNMYSFSFEPNPNWSRMYSGQAEILRYMQHCVTKYQLTPHVRTQSEVIESRWDNQTKRWTLRLTDGQSCTARVIVSGVGGLSRPALPKIKGLDQFKGALFHSADWQHDVTLQGKRVAVIGTGASAIQFVPAIASEVGELLLFQRTPAWIVPKPDGVIPTPIRKIFQYLPPAQRLARHAIYWQSEFFGIGFINPKLMAPISALAKNHLKRQVPNPQLRAKLTPNYTIGCKRVLFSNNYYPALTRDNVQVLNTGVKEVTADGVRDSQGQLHAVDVIICGTGFDVQNPLGPLHVYGDDGLEIRQHGGLSAYMGINTRQMPNLFFLLGPNTALGHNSIIFMIEAQVQYTLKCLAELDRKKATSLTVKPEAEAAFNDHIQAQLKNMVWNAGGCSSWYLDENGKNNTLWPGFTWKYWLETRKPNFSDYLFS